MAKKTINVKLSYAVDGKTIEQNIKIKNANHALLEGLQDAQIHQSFRNNVVEKCESSFIVRYIHTAMGTFVQKTNIPC